MLPVYSKSGISRESTTSLNRLRSIAREAIIQNTSATYSTRATRRIEDTESRCFQKH
ncbi:hypothetical protein PAAG_11251 [Paracoccidioides lutzii Pb01]|uniref:Uncharacterized protein n=1 Tax=Paracoccidioides lutzii (strain ATCC MYA-826 / Pb01) TaxID=502779 RepID=A0A0A2V7K4_PARBA|nr:hypothetical protein PAAG_11251 [Paracoccidioides lutzii Pb01]KGQ02070.1 hypothetical protein PAAG_11251 [Paracoccidioides lutzii Pb01]